MQRQGAPGEQLVCTFRPAYPLWWTDAQGEIELGVLHPAHHICAVGPEDRPLCSSMVCIVPIAWAVCAVDMQVVYCSQ